MMELSPAVFWKESHQFVFYGSYIVIYIGDPQSSGYSGDMGIDRKSRNIKTIA